MSVKIVTAEALNFRSSPEVVAGNKLGTVFLGQKLSDTSASGTDGWLRCSAEIGGSPRDGFVSESFVRDPLTPNREALLAQVHREWMRFERGLGKEHKDPFFRYVGEMWQAVDRNLDGKNRDVPWSAAGISFVVRNAGPAYGKFRFSAAHSRFVHHAINKRIEGDTSVPFWGYRLHETRPELGDIICRDRGPGPDVDYDFARVEDSFSSHSDVVVRIDSDRNKLLAIGFNLSHSCRIEEYDLAPGDFADDTKRVYAILKNITDGVPSV